MITKIEKQKQAEWETYLLEEDGIFWEGSYVRIEITLEKWFSLLLTKERIVTLCSLEN